MIGARFSEALQLITNGVGGQSVRSQKASAWTGPLAPLTVDVQLARSNRPVTATVAAQLGC